MKNVYSAYKGKISVNDAFFIENNKDTLAKLSSSPHKGKQETAGACLFPPMLPPQATEHKVITEKSCEL